jgi:agmatinase
MVDDRLNLPFTGLVSFMSVPTCSDLAADDADIPNLRAPSTEASPWKPGARFAP